MEPLSRTVVMSTFEEAMDSRSDLLSFVYLFCFYLCQWDELRFQVDSLKPLEYSGLIHAVPLSIAITKATVGFRVSECEIEVDIFLAI